MKNCNICKQNKPFSEFSKSNAKRGDGLQYTCKFCNTIEKRKWRENNVNKARNTRYFKKYGIDIEQVNLILGKQNNKCAICDSNIEIGKNAHLDHNHIDGNIRGFLCQKCNHAIGLFKDSTNILKSAILYLDKHSNKE